MCIHVLVHVHACTCASSLRTLFPSSPAGPEKPVGPLRPLLPGGPGRPV